MLHPKERARKRAIDEVERLERERREASGRREPFGKYAELEAAEAAMHTAGEGVASVVACERCGVDVDLDDPATVVFHVTGAVKRVDEYNVDFQHFTIPGALERPEQDEIARCAACAAHLLRYTGRAHATESPAGTGEPPKKEKRS
jgi:hypothetical protein